MRGAEGGARVSAPSEVAGLRVREIVTATGVIHCFEGALAGERRRGTARKRMEKCLFRAHRQHSSKEWGPLAGGNDYIKDGVKTGGNDGREKRKEDREMRQQQQGGQRGARTR